MPPLSTSRLIASLADPADRERVARQLATQLGVDELLLLVPDPEIGVLLPAPGWRQTHQGVRALRAAVDACREPGVHRSRVSSTLADASLIVIRARDSSALVLIGSEPPVAEVAQLEILLPLVAATARSELAARVAEAKAETAREASRHAHDLAAALDATRAQLENSLRQAAALHEEAEKARQRVAILDRVTRELMVDGRDLDATLARLVEATVPTLADWAAIYVPGNDGAIRLAAIASESPEALARARVTLHAQPLSANEARGVAEVLRTGTSCLLAPITDEALRTPLDGYLAALRAYGPRSHLIVALRGHEQTVGVLTLTMTSSRNLGADDRALAEEIANRAALLIEQRRVLDDARSARADAERANRAKDEFLAMLGHELRNPLAPIATALSLMKLRGADTMREERAVIERQVGHLVHLVDDLLEVSRITRGKIALRRAVLDVGEVVAAASEMALPLIEQRRHRFDVHVEPSLYVEADARRLAQVLSNLLNNAAKYTPNGGSIALSARRVGEEVRFAVRDDGVGIEPYLLPLVFDLFTQAPQDVDRASGGLGLGLAIVKSLVELHGGAVRARSDGKGHGTEMVVTLRAVTAAPAAKPPPDRELRAAPAASRRVLVVDDNEDAATLLSELLAELGHDVRTAHDGPTALHVLDGFDVDVALLDIGLPVMNGFELAKHVRARFPRAFLVAVTGYGQAADRRATREAGFDAHVVKPIEIEEVSRMVSRAEPR